MCGAMCILVALVMGMTDVYPNLPWFPDTPAKGGAPPVEGIDFAIPDFSKPMMDLSIAFLLSIPLLWGLSRWLPQSRYLAQLSSAAASGVVSVAAVAAEVESRRGEVGTTTTPLNPGGKALIGDDLCSVITQGEMIDTGASVRVIGSSGSDLIVVEA